MIMRIFKHDSFPYLLLFVVAALIIIPLGWARSKIDPEFLPGVLVESFGFLMDVVFLGIFIVVFNSITEKKRKIERYKEEIDDYRGWNENEASHRIGGLVKRLIKLKVQNLDLSQCFLEQVHFINFKLLKANFYNANLGQSHFKNLELRESIFSYCNFEKAAIHNTDFSMSEMKWVNFTKADLSDSDFSFANLTNGQFIDTDMDNVKLNETNLSFARFYNVKNITYDQLRMANSLYKCEGIPAEIEKQLLKTHQWLYEEP